MSSKIKRKRTVVVSRHGRYPFQRGIITSELMRRGLSMAEAFSLSGDVRDQVADLGEVRAEALEAMLCELAPGDRPGLPPSELSLEEWLRRAEGSVILMVGGATGTGKSTLVTELAYRLGITRVSGTDMIRETLRTVLSREVVPGLHDHSFRVMLQGSRLLSNPRERVLAGFHQQAAQVAVGIRAVIRRAIYENEHLIIEGTHLIPPFSKYLPAGASANMVGVVLSIPEQRLHRERFEIRARRAGRRQSRTYLEAFQAVRWIHDELTQLADEYNELVITDRQLDQTLDNVIGYLGEALPAASQRPAPQGRAEDRAAAVPTLFLILDGMPDEPNPALDNQTPLRAARTPTLRMLAGSGAQGLIRTAVDGERAAGTGEGMLALLCGDDAPVAIGRGLLDALGQGIPLPPEGVVFRGNLATQEGDVLVDRRAGRIRAGTSDLLQELRDVPLDGEVRGHIFPGHEHRAVVLLQGRGLSPAVTDTDPGDRAAVMRRRRAKPLDPGDEAADRTARALEQLLEIAARHLRLHPHNRERVARGLHPANCVITRGGESLARRPVPRADSADVALVAGGGTALGVARSLGFQAVSALGMTGNLDTDLGAKFEAAGRLLQRRDLVVVHIKGTDIAGHDRRPLAKRDFLERVDQALGLFLEDREGLRVVVSSDHPTSSRIGVHLPEPVPVLVATWEGLGEEADFDEESARSGVLGVLEPGELSGLLREG